MGILNTYTIKNEVKRLDEMSKIASDKDEIFDFIEMLLFTVKRNKLESTKMVLELLWKQRLSNVVVNRFIIQHSKNGIDEIRNNLEKHLEFYCKMHEMGFSPYVI